MASRVTVTQPATADALAEQVDALLPQTQCRQCGYTGCRPYAEAISNGTADINRCPPGGGDVIADLAALLQRPAVALDTSCGVTQAPAVAFIDEAWCIGCTLCIQACPVDAIAGAAKVMHTVIANECTGCALCIPPCPVDCIQMVAVAPPADHPSREQRMARAAHARARYVARGKRLGVGLELDITAAHATRAPHQNTVEVSADDRKKHAAVERALARARSRIIK